jgi:hypothetical protein
MPMQSAQVSRLQSRLLGTKALKADAVEETPPVNGSPSTAFIGVVMTVLLLAAVTLMGKAVVLMLMKI